jgi:hypothetical protein
VVFAVSEKTSSKQLINRGNPPWTELPEEVILEIVPMVKEKEPQRWEHQKNPTLGFLGFAGSA